MTAVLHLPGLAPEPLGVVAQIDLRVANDLLVRWGHRLGACRRPFGQQAFALAAAGEPVAVAVSASIVSTTVASFRRDQVVELARLCSAPGKAWASRVMLRLWRELGAPRWPYWMVEAAVSYSQNAHHRGDLYRFDGWERVTDRAGMTGGGGAWTRPRYAVDAAHGAKTLWVWRFDVQSVQRVTKPGEASGVPSQHCACGCGELVEQARTGRPRRYAGPAHRQRAYRRRDGGAAGS
jgi:hypothetical protein